MTSGPCLRRDLGRLVVPHPVADVFDAGLGQQVGRLQRLRQARPEPADRALAGELLEPVHRPHDHAALVLDLVDRALVPGMPHELPAAVLGLPRDALVVVAHARVDRQRRADAVLLVEVEEAPHADAHAVLVPAPVRHVGQQRVALRRRQLLARHRPADVPHLEVDDRPHDDARAAGQLQRRPVDDGGIRRALARLHPGLLHGRAWRHLSRHGHGSSTDRQACGPSAHCLRCTDLTGWPGDGKMAGRTDRGLDEGGGFCLRAGDEPRTCDRAAGCAGRRARACWRAARAWCRRSICGCRRRRSSLDISRIAELRGIAVGQATIRIGALTRHADLIASELIALSCPLLHEAAGHIAHPAIRNRGTIGGSIALGDPAAELPACVRGARCDDRVDGRRRRAPHAGARVLHRRSIRTCSRRPS